MLKCENAPQMLQAFSSFLWPVVVAMAVILFRAHLTRALDAVVANLRRGASVEFFNFKLQGVLIREAGSAAAVGPDLFKKEGLAMAIPATQEDYASRNDFRHESRFVRLVHRICYTGHEKFPYDVSVFIKIEEILPIYTMDKDAKPARMNDIDRVEYYFGHFFGDGEFGSWFVIRNCDDKFAVRFSSGDDVTCVARVYFHDGHLVTLYRYLDLEMGPTLRELSSRVQAPTS